MTKLKKLTTATLVLMAVIFFPSCQTKEIYEEHYDVQVNTFTGNYTVKWNQWHEGTDDDSGHYLYYEQVEPKLTKTVYDRGIMQAFLLMKDQNISPLPFDDFWLLDNGDRRTEQVTCEFRPGVITFILKYSDHDTQVDPYYDYKFRVRFLW